MIEKFQTFIIDPILLVVFAAGFFLFMWGLFEFMVNVNNAAEKETGRQHMLWGTVGMFIMASVYGIMTYIESTIGINPNSTVDTSNINVPTYNFSGTP